MPKKKVKKFRGSGSCGGGSRKNRRGRGNRGGFGNSGHLKHNYIKTVKSGQQIGKYGFTRPAVVKEEYKYRQNFYRVLKDLREEEKIDYNLFRYLSSKSVLNVGDIEEVLEKLKDTDFVTEEKGNFTLNLSELGFQKLLGNGAISKPINVVIGSATEKAINKIEEAGGKVVAVEK